MLAHGRAAREVVMGEPPRPSFRVAVVGALPERDSAPEASRAGERLVTFLDRATVRVREFHHLTLTTFTHGPGTPWAKRRGHSIILIPRFGRTATAERELVEWCDAVVVVGNPAPWARLVRFTSAKRCHRGRVLSTRSVFPRSWIGLVRDQP